MPRHPRYVKNKRVGQRGTVVRGDLIYAPFDGLVGGAPGQGVYEQSVTKRYDIGTRRVTPDGRVYRYGRNSVNALTEMSKGVKNYRCLVNVKDTICKAAAAGVSVIEVATDNFNYTLAEDELRGGYISLYRDADRQQRMITHNTAVPVVAGATCFITLADPLITGINLGDSCEICANPYDMLIVDNHNYTAVMGMPTLLASAYYYFWIQTWGPCRVYTEGTGYPAFENELQFVFGSTGGVITHHEGETYAGYSKQHAGFVINRAAGGIGADHCAPFIMLQISP